MCIIDYKITKKISSKCQKLKMTLTKAQDTENPIQYILNRYSFNKIDEIINTELKELNSFLDNYELLDTIFKNHIPIEELVGKISYENTEAFNIAYYRLESERPKKSHNNINDALNVAAVVWMYTSPSRLRMKQPIPVLISQTREVLNLNLTIQNKLRLDDDIKFELFNNAFYLFISQYLTNYTQGRTQLILNFAEALAEYADALVQAYKNLIAAIHKKEIQLTDFDSAEWGLLRLNYKQFYTEWQMIIEPLKLTQTQDRLSYINSLSTEEYNQLSGVMTAEKPVKVERAIDTILRLLHETIARNANIETLLLEGEPILVEQAKNTEIIPAIFAFSVILPSEDKGEAFSQITAKNDLDKTEITEDMLLEGIRIFVHTKYLLFKGAFLSLDIKKTSAKNDYQIGISWPHQCDVMNLVKLGVDYLNRIDGDQNPDIQFVLTICYSDGNEKSVDFTSSDIAKTLDENKILLRRSDYIEIDLGELIFYADLHPQDNIETQAGLILDCHQCKKNLKYISKLVSETSFEKAIAEIHDRFNTQILNYIFKKIGI